MEGLDVPVGMVSSSIAILTCTHIIQVPEALPSRREEIAAEDGCMPSHILLFHVYDPQSLPKSINVLIANSLPEVARFIQHQECLRLRYEGRA
jgi:hypothetical protein